MANHFRWIGGISSNVLHSPLQSWPSKDHISCYPIDAKSGRVRQREVVSISHNGGKVVLVQVPVVGPIFDECEAVPLGVTKKLTRLSTVDQRPATRYPTVGRATR
jgi:hypothetical protein